MSDYTTTPSPTETLHVSAEKTETPMIATKVVIEPTLVPTATATPVDRITTVSVDSDAITGWYQQFWREVSIQSCDGCSASEIETAVGFVFTSKTWNWAQSGSVYYTHSGWQTFPRLGEEPYGPEFGQTLVRVIRYSDPVGTELCLGHECYTLVAFHIQDKVPRDGILNLEDIFDITSDDIFFVTCNGASLLGRSSQKLIVQYRMINKKGSAKE
ncbi:hypothetical protein K8R20_00040 [bacterium]|nr:hypothetical protein [bacterium]